MYELKTKETDSSVIEFIENIENPKKREDAFQLLDIFTETTGFQAKMWGPSIIGFGAYHYKYSSGHEGEAPLVGFSPRKAKISLYFAPDEPKREELLKSFGKHTTGKSCVYINKVDDIDKEVLKELIIESVKYMQEFKKKRPSLDGPTQKKQLLFYDLKALQHMVEPCSVAFRSFEEIVFCNDVATIFAVADDIGMNNFSIPIATVQSV